MKPSSKYHDSSFLFIAALGLLLTACGGSDTVAPTWTAASETIGVNDAIVFHFSESMDAASVSYAGNLGTLASVATATWSQTNTANDTLTLNPPTDGWISGLQDLQISVADTAGKVATETTSFAIRLVFNNFQSASVVLGQADFSGKAANRGATTAADSLYEPVSNPMVIDGRLWVAEAGNNRIIGYDGIPATNGASASYVIGQSTFTDNGGGASATQLLMPTDVAYDNGAFFISDIGNSRVLVYDGVPLSPPGTASHLFGQADFSSSTTGCSDTQLYNQDAITAVDGKLIVADFTNSRVLIWNTAPTSVDNTPPDIVLGQSDFNHCTHDDDNQDGAVDTDASARTLSYPFGVWSNGKMLIVADSYNNRILIWNSFPTSNFQPADMVVGQASFAHMTALDDNQDRIPDAYPTARTLYNPSRVWSNGLQLVVVDKEDNRVLVWNSIPTTMFQPADVVLGQSDFTGKKANDDNQDGSEDALPSARTFNMPWGVGAWRNKLLVTDVSNNRVLVFKSN